MSAFFDSNVPLYLLSADDAKADVAEDLLSEGGTISVQVLNEFVAVAVRKRLATWQAIEDTLATLRSICRVEPLTIVVHDRAVRLARKHGFAIDDAMIIASAAESGATTLYTEDLQHGRRIEGLVIRNPFRPAL